MARPRTGKIVEKELRVPQKNGDIYVYWRSTKYDPETRNTKTLSKKLIGKIPKGQDMVVPTRPKKKPENKPQQLQAVRVHKGLERMMNCISREEGILEDLREVVDEGDALKLDSIARYWICTDGQALPRIEGYQLMHNLPYVEGISEDVYYKLFKEMGQNEEVLQNFFQKRLNRCDDKEFVGLDSTTFSTYSKNQKEARFGFSKEPDGMPTIKWVTFLGLKSLRPIAFAKQPGNIPDVSSVRNALSQVRCLEGKPVVIVADNGYYSQENMEAFFNNEMEFLILATKDVDWIRKAIDESRRRLMNQNCLCPFDTEYHCMTSTVSRPFTLVRKKDSPSGKIGTSYKTARKVRLFINYSLEQKLSQEADFDASLMTLKHQIESGEVDFKPAAQNKIKKFLNVKTNKSTGIKTVTFKNQVCLEAKKYFGFFVLVSNVLSLEAFDALFFYRRREKIEEMYSTFKRSAEGKKPHIWMPDSLRGRQWAQFLAVTYRMAVERKLRDMKVKLERRTPGTTEKQRDLEVGLLKWIRKKTIPQIFDWFDCVEETTVTGKAFATRWTTETVARDELFLKLFGVEATD